MKNRVIVAVGALITASLVSVGGCSLQEGDKPAVQAGLFSHVQKTGGQIWAENCTRCHNPRPSTQYSPQQWDLITSHMRLRCDLNGEEQRAVYHFMSGS